MRKFYYFWSFCWVLLGTTTKAQAPFSWDNATVYFLLTDRFHNGNTANDLSYGRTADAVGGFLGGDLAGLTAKINANYFNDLGVNAIWITAPYEQIHGAVPGYWLPSGYPGGQHYAYHGYYPLDWTEMDANMGTKADFQTMIDAAHAKGIRILMDIVINHTGYETVTDSQTYGFGTLGDPWTVPNTGLDVNNASWCNWWVDNNGVSWIRKGDTNTDYCSPACGGGDLAMCLAGLPDVRTDLTTAVGLPKILQTKWDATKEAQEVAELDAFFMANPSYTRTPANYIIKWLTDWVREFGIDGFRIDTYKHVETPVWGRLKDQAQIAFDDWKAANPSKKLDDKPFWMVGELFGAGITKNTDAVTNGKTDALINFNFQGGTYAPSTLEAIYASYAAATNNDPNWNFLSYISSHDKDMYDRSNLTAAGTALLLAPGAVQIYYGDETARPKGTTGTDQDSRTYMNWGSINTTLQAHWQKLGKFRQNHLAVGAGQHQKLADAPYTFRRTYNSASACDAVVVVLGASGSTTVNVSSVFENGVQLRDAYTGNTATVSGGNVTFTAHTNGVVLIERVNAAPCPPSVTFTTQPPKNPTDWYDASSLSVGISAAIPSGNPVTIYYTTNGDTPTATSTVYGGTPLALGNPTDITLKAIACENGASPANCSAVLSQRYVVGTIPPFKVYFKKPASWAANITPKVYWWGAQPTGNLTDGTWPGANMTAECDGWFSYTFNNILSTNIIFNNGSGSGTNQTNNLTANQTSYYDDPVLQSGSYTMKNGVPTTLNCTAPTACFTAVPTSGAAPLMVSLNATCSSTPGSTTITGYSWNFGDGNTATGISPSHTYTSNGTFTITLTITNSASQTATSTTTITVGSSTALKVFFQKPSTWPTGTPKIYYWNTLPSGSTPAITWENSPSMTEEGNGWFSHTFSTAVTSTNLIFRDANTGSTKTADLAASQSGWYPDCLAGWTYSDPRSIVSSNYDIYFENTANWTQPKVYYWNIEPATAGPAPVGWSGANMTLVSGNKWRFSFTGTRKVCVIFNNGSGVQSSNQLSLATGGTYNFGTGVWTPNCPTNVQFNSTLSSGTYPSGNTIDAINNINSGTNIIFDAKNTVTLSPGFQAQTGSVFLAKIGGCN